MFFFSMFYPQITVNNDSKTDKNALLAELRLPIPEEHLRSPEQRWYTLEPRGGG